MTLVQSLYILLLKSSLWKSAVDPTLFEGVGPNEWQNILKLSTRQRTTAFIAHSIQSCPKPFCLQVATMETHPRNRKDRRGQSQIERNDSLSKQGIPFYRDPFVLLKGQGVALDYPDPTKRTPATSIFFYKEQDYPKAKEWYSERV